MIVLQEATVEYKNAPLLARFFARYIDRLVAIGGCLLLGFAIWNFSEGLAIVAGLGTGVLYSIFKDSLPLLNGQSIGKKVLGLKVIDRNSGESIQGAYGKSILREFPQWIPLLNLIDMVMVFDNGYRIGDNMAQTRVVKL